ncbi:hypothetical protein [Nocardioides pelophilus]|uniref:hypothetical protein n=1 Tax=Nocardioides pelophilus TaxID=2172019 RepID=UPI001600D0B9|nr:hypothetical protein [Nocardioides pelophilus]
MVAEEWVGHFDMYLDASSPLGMAVGDGRPKPLVPYTTAADRFVGVRELLWSAALRRGSSALPLSAEEVELSERIATNFLRGVRLENLDFNAAFGGLEVIVSFDRNDVSDRVKQQLERSFERLQGLRLATPPPQQLADLALSILAEGIGERADSVDQTLRSYRLADARNAFVDLGDLLFSIDSL